MVDRGPPNTLTGFGDRENIPDRRRARLPDCPGAIFAHPLRNPVARRLAGTRRCAAPALTPVGTHEAERHRRRSWSRCGLSLVAGIAIAASGNAALVHAADRVAPDRHAVGRSDPHDGHPAGVLPADHGHRLGRRSPLHRTRRDPHAGHVHRTLAGHGRRDDSAAAHHLRVLARGIRRRRELRAGSPAAGADARPGPRRPSARGSPHSFPPIPFRQLRTAICCSW